MANTSKKASRSAASPSASGTDRPPSITRLHSAWAVSAPAAISRGEGERPLVWVAGDDLVGEADAQRLLGADLPAGDAQLLGAARSDEAGEPLRAATTRHDAEEDLRLPEHRPLAGDPVVARQRQLAAAAEGVAADGGDDEAIEGGDGVVGGVEPLGDRPRLGLAGELVDVGTGGEDPLTTGDDDGAREVGGELADRRLEFPEQGRREGVDLAVAQA